MAVTVGTLTIDLKANTASFSSSMDKMSQLSAKTSNDIKRSLEKITTAGIAMAVAIAGGTTAIIVKAFDAADAMGKMADSVGTTTEKLSVLSYAASLSNVSNEQLGVGLEKLSKSAFMAQNGNQQLINVFGRLGVATTDSGGKLRDSGEVFSDVAVKFAGMESGAGKTALAMALFGKSGAALIPLLNQYGGEQEKVNKEAADFGLILGSKTAEAAGIAHDNLDRLSAVARGFGQSLLAAVLPSLSKVLEKLIEVAKNANIPALAQSFGQKVSTAIDNVGKALEFAATHANELKIALEALAAIQIAKIALPVAAQLATGGWSKVGAGIGQFVVSLLGLKTVMPILTGFTGWLGTAIPLLGVAGGAADVFSSALAAIGGPITVAVGALAGLLTIVYTTRDALFTLNGEVFKLRDVWTALSQALKWGPAFGGAIGGELITAQSERETREAKKKADDAAAAKKKADADAAAAAAAAKKKKGGGGDIDTGGILAKKDPYKDEIRKLDQAIASQRAYLAVVDGTPDEIAKVTAQEQARASVLALTNQLTDSAKGKLTAQQEATITQKIATQESLKALDDYGKAITAEQRAAELATSQTAVMAAAIGEDDEAVRRATVNSAILGLTFGKTSDQAKEMKDRVETLRDLLNKRADAEAFKQFKQQLDDQTTSAELATEQANKLAAANLEGDDAAREAAIANTILALTYNRTAKEVDDAKKQLNQYREALSTKATTELIASTNKEIKSLQDELKTREMVLGAIFQSVEAQREAQLAAKLYAIDQQIATTKDKDALESLAKKRELMIQLTQAEWAESDAQQALALQSPVTQYQEEIRNLQRAVTTLESAQGGLLTYGQALNLAGKSQDAFNRLTDATITNLLRFGKAGDGVKAFFLDMQRQAQSSASIIYEAMHSAFDKLSENLTDLILQGKNNFAQMFEDLGKQILNASIKKTLQQALGGLGQKLGINLGTVTKPDGSASNPFFVKVVGGGGSLFPSLGGSSGGDTSEAEPSVGGTLAKLGGIFGRTKQGGIFGPTSEDADTSEEEPSGATNIFKSIFGKLGGLFGGGGGGDSEEGSSSGGLFGGGDQGGGIFSFLGKLIPHAEGGPVSPNSAYLVGERGPEPFFPGVSGSMLSNASTRRLLGATQSGTAYYSIDARGANAADVEDRVQRSIAAVHEQAVKSSAAVQSEMAKRRPGGRQ